MHLNFDWTINISTICSTLLIVGAIVNYGRKVVSYLRVMGYRVNVMWTQFKIDHPDAARDEAIESTL